MFQLVYVSSATTPFGKPELQALLSKARKNNTALGVTGMLLYKDGNFMQVLEGEEAVVTKVAKTIEADARHKGVLVLLRANSPERQFLDWSMGFRDLTFADAEKLPGYSDFINSPLNSEEFTQHPGRAMKLLTLFKKSM